MLNLAVSHVKEDDEGHLMNEQIEQLMREIGRLEEQLEAELREHQSELVYWFEGKKVKFEHSVIDAHRRIKVGLLRWLRSSNPRNVASAPFIYSMVIPFFFLDCSITVYQAICFRLYGIPRVRRNTFIVIDRFQLNYLNVIERVNCIFCGYGNGVIAYAREVSARTEQYWCPVKHARKVLDPHTRYARFADFGDAESFHAATISLREELRLEDV